MSVWVIMPDRSSHVVFHIDSNGIMLPLSVIRAHWRLLGFGFAMALFSSFGQTFFISLFGAEIRSAFSLSHGDFGTVYAVATLSSAAVLVFAGRLIDKWTLAAFSAVCLFGLALATTSMALATSSAMLTATIFGLRFFGQGLTSHASVTAMARYFEAERGRAVALASLGHSVGEAILPPLVVAALVFASWRNLWFASAGFVVFAAIPLILCLLKDHRAHHAAFAAKRKQTARVDFTLKETLRDAGLYLRLPALLSTSSIGTGLVFHQVHIATTKGWPLSLMAASFSLYAVGSVVTTIASGALVDKVGARRLVPVFLIPLMATCIAVTEIDATWGAPVFFGLMGVAAGINAAIQGAIWAELYGVTHLGSIRAFGQAAMVFSTGVAPAVMGLLFDAGLTIAAIAWGSVAISIAASLLSALASTPRARVAA